MDPLYLSYAEKMNTLGDKILDITKQFPTMEGCATVEEVNDRYDTYLKKISEFKNFKLTFMLKLFPGTYPDIIKNEQEELVEQLQKFIEGTDYMANALDISHSFLDKDHLVKGIVFDKDMFVKGSLVQQKAAETTALLIEQICIKFGI